MSQHVFENIRIAGIAGAAPSKVISNKDYYERLGRKAVDDFIKLTGIERHHKSPAKQTACDLGYAAARGLLKKLDIDKEEIGGIIDVTQSGDYLEPATAFVFHKRLALPESCLAFDVNLGCSGYVNGLNIAASLLQTMEARYILLIAGDVRKRPEVAERKHPDPSNFLMPGDCATATLVERTSCHSEMVVHLYSDGQDFQMLHKLGANRCLDLTDEVLTTPEGVEYSLLDHYMDGMGVFAFSTRRVPEAMQVFWEKTGTGAEDFAYYFFHQANGMIVKRIAKKLKLPMERVPLSLVEYGNTSSGSVPMTAVYQLGAEQSELPLPCILCGFGVGLSWGVVSADLVPATVLPVIINDDYYEEGENIYLEAQRYGENI